MARFSHYIRSLLILMVWLHCLATSVGQGDDIDNAEITDVQLTLSDAQEKYDAANIQEALHTLKLVDISDEAVSINDRISYNNLIGLCYLRLGQLDSAEFFIQNTIEATSFDDHPKKYAAALSYLGMIAEDQGKLNEAIDLYDDAIEALELISDTFRLASTINNLGLTYDKTGNVSGALDQYYRALELFSHLNHLRAMCSINLNIGKVHYGIENYEDALTFFHAGLQKSIEGNILSSQANALNNIGAIYLDISNLDSAKIYLEKSLQLADETNDVLRKSTAKNNLSKIYKSENNYDKAIMLNKEALMHAQDIGSIRPQIFAYYELSQNYKLSGNYGSYKKYIAIAASMADEYGEPFLINRIQNELYLINKESNPQAALAHLERSVTYKDSLINKANLIDATKRDLEYKFEKEQFIKDQELQQAETEAALNKVKIKQQRFTYLIILVVATLLLGLLLIYLNQLRTQKELADQKSIVKSQKITQLEKEK